MKQRAVYVLIIILAFSLAACGGGDKDEPSSGNNTSATTETSSTNTVQATSSNTNNNGGAATDTSVEVEGGTLKFALPPGWVLNTDDGILFANSDAALAATDDSLESGQVRVKVQWIADGSETLSALGLRDTSPPMQALPIVVAGNNDETATYEVGTPRGGIIGGSPLAMTTGTVNMDGTVADSMIFMVDKKDGYVIIFATAPSDEVGQYEGALRAMLSTIVFEAA